MVIPFLFVGTWRLCGWSGVSPPRSSSATPRRRFLSERAQAPCARPAVLPQQPSGQKCKTPEVFRLRRLRWRLLL